jgi:hypothetical protein
MAAARARESAGETRVKSRSDAYVGLLGLSLLALGAATLFAFLNWDTIKEKPPKSVQMAPQGGGAARPLAPGGPAVNPPTGAPTPGVNPPGNPPGNVPPGNPPGNVPPANPKGNQPPPPAPPQKQ